MKKTNLTLPVRLLNLILFLFFIPKLSDARSIDTQIDIIVKDTEVGTLDCYAYDIVLEAYIEDVCAIGETKWTYLLINSDNGDTLQYSHNYLPVPGEGKAGDENFDILSDMIAARMKITEPLGIGNYKLVWQMSNECGDAGTKEQNIKVIDKIPPTPVLIDYYVNSGDGGYFKTAKSFDKGITTSNSISSYDNCTQSGNLYFTFSPILPNVWVQPEKWSNQYSLYGKNFFDPHTGAISTEAKFFYGVADAWHPISKTSERYWFCDYYVPESQTIKIYVWDKFAQGNINDPLNCSFDTSIIYFNCHFYYPAISGTIRTKKNMNPIQSMNLKASYDEGYFTYLSKMDGTYEITCNPNEEYKITCSKDSDYMNGVTTLDLILINRHILGIKPITDPFKLIASDANNSKSITSADILEIRNLILGNINKFKNHSWIGLKPNFTFANPLNPFPELENASTIVVQMKNSNIQNIDFQGIKIGDINYNALENRNMNKYSFILDNIQLEKDIGYRIPIFSKNFINVNGFQFALDISGFSGFEIENGAISFDHHDYNIIDNKFIVSYINPGGITINNDEVLFTLLIKANEKINLNAKLKFDEKIMPSELYVVNSDEVTDLQLEYRTVDFEVHQNEPNPFTYETEIKFYLTKLSEFDLKVFDINGREIYCKKSIGNEGMNSIILNKDILKTSGAYFYKLVAGDNTAAKKMMFLN